MALAGKMALAGRGAVAGHGALRRGAVVFAARQRQRLLSMQLEQIPETYSEPADPYHGMELTFLGAGSQVSPRNNPSSLALRLRSHNLTQLWLFDAGEGALRQLQCSHLRVSQLRNVFITHMHPDHVFGLPGIIMSALSVRVGPRRDKDGHLRDPGPAAAAKLPPLTVYGPPGIQTFLRSALGTTLPLFREPNLLRIVELRLPTEGPSSAKRFPARAFWNHRVRKLPFEMDSKPLDPQVDGETGNATYDVVHTHKLDPRDDASVCRDGGQADDAAASGDTPQGLWPANVQAGLVSHSIPSIAYLISEDTSGFRFDKDKLLALGLPTNGDHATNGVFQRLQEGNSAEFNGGIIRPSDVSRKARLPRRICICGDTSDASGVEHLAKDVDVLVHEATLRAADTDIAKKRGHSSSSSAAEFAKRVGAKRLILNHTSVAYDGHEVRGLEAEARRIFGVDRAFVAHDMSVFNVPRHDKPDPFRSFLGFPRCGTAVRHTNSSLSGALIDTIDQQPDVGDVQKAEDEANPMEAANASIEISRINGKLQRALLLRENRPSWVTSSASDKSRGSDSRLKHAPYSSDLGVMARQQARAKRFTITEKDLATPLHAFSKRNRSFAAV